MLVWKRGGGILWRDMRVRGRLVGERGGGVLRDGGRGAVGWEDVPVQGGGAGDAGDSGRRLHALPLEKNI